MHFIRCCADVKPYLFRIGTHLPALPFAKPSPSVGQVELRDRSQSTVRTVGPQRYSSTNPSSTSDRPLSSCMECGGSRRLRGRPPSHKQSTARHRTPENLRKRCCRADAFQR
jgi:hypothetical protein